MGNELGIMIMGTLFDNYNKFNHMVHTSCVAGIIMPDIWELLVDL